MIDPSLPKLTRVMSRSRRPPLTGSLPSPDQVKKFESPSGIFCCMSTEAISQFQGAYFTTVQTRLMEVSDKMNAKRIEMSGMKESGQKIVSPDALTYTENNFPLGGTDTAETVYRFDDPTGLI
jgi:hypothetical protein